MSTTQYADSLREFLVRKIVKAERELQQLKMDYCRFMYGISHRTQIKFEGGVYLVQSVDLNSMQRLDNGEWGKPCVTAIRLDGGESEKASPRLIPSQWELC
ncbi:hypothetical protein HCH_04038 [Hahella chejuensis KCTC 2396]|uniref:Uncharacterized protein n=1 Tax=Hahella chejuensis (strain KCTC 2396) TaxID=349521 RepID=Q2SF21_HAHCH|nr:hypothetical protein [Hahella chejuensis]ABC30753.1 hypothetical protein HCH_04038 [Hahella chejuensis KCTC 2396]